MSGVASTALALLLSACALRSYQVGEPLPAAPAAAAHVVCTCDCRRETGPADAISLSLAGLAAIGVAGFLLGLWVGRQLPARAVRGIPLRKAQALYDQQQVWKPS